MDAAMQVSGSSGGFRDRRVTARFPLNEEVAYKVLNARGARICGSGRTLNIGSGGILFTTGERLPVGRTLEMAVNWPALLGGSCPLKFVAVGRIVRSDETQAVMRIERYEFRTRRASAAT